MKCIVEIVSVVLVMLATIHTVSSISCYQCNSKDDADCDKNPVDGKYLVDCRELKDGTKYDRCRKIDQWVDFSVGELKPNLRVIRSCGWNQTDDHRACYYRAGFGGRQLVCTCHADNCNSAGRVGVTALTVACATMVLLLKAVL